MSQVKNLYQLFVYVILLFVWFLGIYRRLKHSADTTAFLSLAFFGYDYQSLGSNIWPNGLVFKKINPAKLNYGPCIST